jgi:transposase-like protein
MFIDYRNPFRKFSSGALKQRFKLWMRWLAARIPGGATVLESDGVKWGTSWSGWLSRRVSGVRKSQSWRRVWSEVIPFFAFPGDVRRILYTTNAIEALNSKLRRAVRARGHFPTDEAATKRLFLVLNRSEKEWIVPPREWCVDIGSF